MDDRQKQIEEMAKVIENRCNRDCIPSCDECIAQTLYNAGYRRQREGEWREDVIAFCNVCSLCQAKVDRYAIKCNSGKLHYCPNCGARMKGDEGK